jgi:hypothetical protein
MAVKALILRTTMLFIVMITFSKEAVEAQTHKSASGREQSIFASEGVKVAHPIDPPESALQVLRKDQFVRSCVGDNESPGEIPGYWFVGSEIRLGATKDENDLVIQPRELPGSPSENRCLWHAHSIPFWVLKRTADGYALILDDNAQVLKVLNSRSNGFRDIETSMTTTSGRTTSVFKWDGRRYSLAASRTTSP